MNGSDKERVRQALVAEVAALKPGEIVPTMEMGNRVFARCSDLPGQTISNYMNAMVAEGRFPECQRTGETFVAYGRVNYRRAWFGPGAKGQPIPPAEKREKPTVPTLAARMTAVEGALVRLTEQVASLLAPARTSDTCIICKQEKPLAEFAASGICTACDKEPV